MSSQRDPQEPASLLKSHASMGWASRSQGGPVSPPLPRSSCGKPLTTWCARCSTASRRCSRAPGPSRCVPLVPALAWVPQRLTWLPSTGLALSLVRLPQRWLTESARLIAHSGSAVEWITPLGIPIIQPYHRDCRYKVCAPHPAALCPAVPPFLCWAGVTPLLMPPSGRGRQHAEPHLQQQQ